MNKRQSKKQELQAQVDNLQVKVEKFRRNMNLNATIANQNQETTADEFEKLIKMNEDVVRTVSNNRLYILDIQKQFKYLIFISIIHSIAIFALAAAIVFISIRVMS